MSTDLKGPQRENVLLTAPDYIFAEHSSQGGVL
jgi:hypothetical protein